jgi:hypothetical protein
VPVNGVVVALPPFVCMAVPASNQTTYGTEGAGISVSAVSQTQHQARKIGTSRIPLVYCAGMALGLESVLLDKHKVFP